MNIIKKALFVLICSIVSVAPILLSIGFWYVLHPTTFWQKFMLFLLCFITFGPAEVLCFVLGIGIILLLGESKKEVPTYNFDNRVDKY